MNWRAVIHPVSFVLVILGLAMGACAGLAHAMGDPRVIRVALLEAGGLTLAGGLLAWLVSHGSHELTRRDGFGVVVLGWLAVGLFGALPYLRSGVIASPMSAFFESVSGFTTTGASVLWDLERLPRGVLFWRSLTHFFGGMGVLVLCVAILPLLGTGGMQIFRAEVAGPSKNRLTPRITSTAKLLWTLYVGLIAILAVLLRAGGMSWFDAWCHAFGTVATGGFSTRTDSIGAYPSSYIQMVVVAFMLLSSINFTLHYLFLRGQLGVHFRSAEFRFFSLLWLVACIAVTLRISLPANAIGSWGECARRAVFQVTSLMSTTGFSTADYDVWPGAVRLGLMALVALGGCAGSTAGGMKTIRVYVALKSLLREVQRVVTPNSVVQVKVDGEPVPIDAIAGMITMVLTYIGIAALASLGMTFFVPDLETAVSSVITTLSGCGPGLALVGPARTYADIPALGKLLLTGCMYLGRLEFFSIIVLLLPRFWRH